MILLCENPTEPPAGRRWPPGRRDSLLRVTAGTVAWGHVNATGSSLLRRRVVGGEPPGLVPAVRTAGTSPAARWNITRAGRSKPCRPRDTRVRLLLVAPLELLLVCLNLPIIPANP